MKSDLRTPDLLTAEAMSNRIRRINAAGIISTFAGGKVLYARMVGPSAGTAR